jgi:hypothetical protein
MTIHKISAEELAKAMSTMPADEKRKFLEKLNSGMIEQISASEAADAKKVRLGSVRAARVKAVTDLATSNELAFLDGMLRRAGLPTVEAFAERGPVAIDALMASASRPMTLEQKFEVKGRLHRLGLA